MQGAQSIQLSLCDDFIQFNDKLSKSSHNIKKHKNYKRIQLQMMKLNEKQSNNCTSKQNGFVCTIDSSIRIQDQHESQQKMKLKLQSLQMRRNSVTAGNSRRRHQQTLKSQNISKTLNLTTHHSNNNASFRQPQLMMTLGPKNFTSRKKQNKYKMIEKELTKGPLKQKFLISWLNALLVEACQNQKFDTGIQNAALRKYGIDQNSLRSKGIKPQNVYRIYKTLYVYSLGFNNLLKQICDDNMNLRKTIWKVYAVLLDYCAEGTFQTMINQIKRQNRQKVDSLVNQLIQKQKQIENYDDFNEKKNQKIYKRNKQLEQQYLNLTRDYENKTQELRQADEAFNSQVTLRLQFQNKINQIHGIYADIQTKHERLKHNFDLNKKQLQQLRALTNKQTKQITELKCSNQQKRNNIMQISKSLKFQLELSKQLQVKKNHIAGVQIQNQNAIKDLKLIIQQKMRQISQLNSKIYNSNLMYQIQRREREQISQVLSKTYEQNHRLHGTIQSQKVQLDSLLLQKRNFGLTTSQRQAEIVILNGRLTERNQQIKSLNKEIQNLKQKIKSLQRDIEFQTKIKIQTQQDLKICHQSIKQMKKSKNIMQQQYDELKRKTEAINQILEQKNKQIASLTGAVNSLTQQVSSCLKSIKVLQSTLELLKQKMKSSEETANKKYSQLKKQKEDMQQEYNKFMNIKKAMQEERDDLRAKLQQIQLSWKNEKFQRTNLKVFYNGALKSIEQKSQLIKRLDITISVCQQEHNDTKRKLKNLEFTSQQKQKNYRKQKRFWQQKLKNLGAQNIERVQYIHPMIFQDVAQNYHRVSANFQQFIAKTKKHIQQLNKIINQKKAQLVQIVKNNQKQLQQLTKNYQILLQKKENLLVYETNKNSYLTEQNKELQTQLTKYTSNDTKKKMSFEKQQKYLSQINQKKQKINSLMSDLQKAHDANRQLRQNYMNFEQKMKEKQVVIQKKQAQIVEHKKQIQQHIVNRQKQITLRVEQIIKNVQSQYSRRASSRLNNNQLQSEKDRKKSGKNKQRNNSSSNCGPFSNSAGKRQQSRPDTRQIATKIRNAYIHYNK